MKLQVRNVETDESSSSKFQKAVAKLEVRNVGSHVGLICNSRKLQGLFEILTNYSDKDFYSYI